MDNPKTLSETIAEQLADEIIRRQIPPGTRLDEQSLADRFGVSRSPIRDALRNLAATRLVDHVPRRGDGIPLHRLDDGRGAVAERGDDGVRCGIRGEIAAACARGKRIGEREEEDAPRLEGGLAHGVAGAGGMVLDPACALLLVAGTAELARDGPGEPRRVAQAEVVLERFESGLRLGIGALGVAELAGFPADLGTQQRDARPQPALVC